jgi:hypothetical protein
MSSHAMTVTPSIDLPSWMAKQLSRPAEVSVFGPVGGRIEGALFCDAYCAGSAAATRKATAYSCSASLIRAPHESSPSRGQPAQHRTSTEPAMAKLPRGLLVATVAINLEAKSSGWSIFSRFDNRAVSCVFATSVAYVLNVTPRAARPSALVAKSFSWS